MWLRKVNIIVGWSILVLLSTYTRADDTELFIYDFNKAGDFRPKVLLIFDTSGSMSDTMQVSEPYDPTKTYPALPKDPDSNNSKKYIYFSSNSSVPSITSTARFPDSLNACASSKSPLSTVGQFVSAVWTYKETNFLFWRYWSWGSISGEQESDIKLVDCQQDVTARNTANPYGGILTVSTGYPIKGNSTATAAYTADVTNAFNNNTGITLYSANYIRWYNGPGQPVNKSRLSIAKSAVNELISSTPGVDFGLAVFNKNNSQTTNGGRIVRNILGSEVMLSNGKTGEQDLLDKINALNADSNTPLCETLQEAYQFFGGKSVVYGSQGSGLSPVRDTSAENPLGTYKAPYDKCSNNGYVIYITDGEPTSDTSSDSTVKGLIDTLSANDKKAYGSTVSYGTGNNKGNSYLAALAGYMKHNDVNSIMSDKQTVTTFTVGFGDEAITGAGNLLAETARRGGGEYYPATDASALSDALKSSLLAILRINSSLVSPAIASNNFDRTRSNNNIYYAMFEPDAGPRWKGNLKKLMLSSNGYVMDSRGLPAIKPDGSIIDNAQTFWSSGRDGNRVAEGGVQEMLAAKSSRNLYVINNSQRRLDIYTKANLVSQAGTESALISFMQASDSTDLGKLIDWAAGKDTYDEDFDTSTVTRRYIMGDPLHSHPLVLNYGPPSGNPADAPDLRILVGTNAGFLHMFKDSGNTIDESWSVIPYEFLGNQRVLRVNADSADHIYGMDASPVALIEDVNHNGVLKSSEGDKVSLFTGLRSGGRAYYSFDLSNADTPVYKWTINSQSSGFTGLGLTWSVPEVAFVPGVTNPVLIFAGGYDTNKNVLGMGTRDAMGVGIYIVDSATGNLVFSATPATGSATNLQASGMQDSMPGSVAILDSDGDSKVDRIYMGDTGGNIWRMDLPSINKSEWSVFKFARLGADRQVTPSVLADDRRFFTQPIVVRTINKKVTASVVGGNTTYTYQDVPFDAVLIGSGDRNRPSSESTVHNGYFMLRDYDVVARTSTSPARSPIVVSDLYDVTSDPLSDQTTANGILAVKAGITSAKGWVNWLDEPGEKSLGAGLVLQGKLYFTSFLPQVQSFQQCTIQSIGASRQYMVDMHYGTTFRYVVDQAGNTAPERYVEVQNKVADDLVVHAGDDAKIRILGGGTGDKVILKDDGNGGKPERCTVAGECVQGTEEAEMDMSPKKIYLYEGESQ